MILTKTSSSRDVNEIREALVAETQACFAIVTDGLAFLGATRMASVSLQGANGVLGLCRPASDAQKPLSLVFSDVLKPELAHAIMGELRLFLTRDTSGTVAEDRLMLDLWRTTFSPEALFLQVSQFGSLQNIQSFLREENDLARAYWKAASGSKIETAAAENRKRFIDDGKPFADVQKSDVLMAFRLALRAQLKILAEFDRELDSCTSPGASFLDSPKISVAADPVVAASGAPDHVAPAAVSVARPASLHVRRAGP